MSTMKRDHSKRQNSFSKDLILRGDMLVLGEVLYNKKNIKKKTTQQHEKNKQPTLPPLMRTWTR